MAQELTLLPAGWITDPNPHSASPPGAATEFSNVIIERRGLVQPRDGYVQDSVYSTTVGNSAARVFQFLSDYYAWESLGLTGAYDFLIRRSDGGQVMKGSATGPAEPVKSVVGKAQAAKAAKNFYLTTNDGVRRMTTSVGATGLRAELSGVSQGLTPIISIASSVQYNAWFEVDSAVAYRIVYQKRVNDIPLFGAPSGYTLFKRAAGAGVTANLQLEVPIQSSILGPSGATNIVAGDRLLVYRTTQTYVAAGGGADISPGDEMQLVMDVEITASDVGAGYKTIIDQTADANLGAFLYTNATLEGILQANNRAPIADEIVDYAGSLYYGNCELWNEQSFDIVQPEDLQVLAVTPVGTTVGQPYIVLGGAATVKEEALGMWVGGFDQFGGGLYTGDPKNGSVAFPGFTQIIAVDVPGNRYEVSNNALATFAGGFEGVEIHPYIAFVCQGQIDKGLSPPYTSDIYWAASTSTPQSVANQTFTVDPNNAFATCQNLASIASRQADRFFNIYPSGGDEEVGSFLVQEVAPRYSCADPPTECEAFGSVTTAYAPAMTSGVIPNPFAFGSGLKFLDPSRPNRVYYSKQSIPEAVPALNYLDVGDRSGNLLRMIRTRESLLIFKTDGIFRLTATSTFDQRLDLVDPTYVLLHPDAACAFNNQVFAWTNQGVIMVSDSGVQSLSAQTIQSQLDPYQEALISYQSLGTSSQIKPFAFADETRDIAYLGLPSASNRNYCTDVAVYAARSGTWSKFTFTDRYLRDGMMPDQTINLRLSAILSGSSTAPNSRLYVQTPQTYDSTVPITINAATGTSITLAASSYSPSPGDAIIQGGTKYLIEGVSSPTSITVNASGLAAGAADAYVAYTSAIQFIAKEAQNPGALKHWLYVTPVFEALKELTQFFATFYTNADPSAIMLKPTVPYSTLSSQRIVRLTPTRQHSRAAELVIKFEFRTALAEWVFSGMSLTYSSGSTRVQR